MMTAKETREKLVTIVNKLIQNETLRAKSAVKLNDPHVSDEDKEFINVCYSFTSDQSRVLAKEYMEALNEAIPDEEKEDSESIIQK